MVDFVTFKSFAIANLMCCVSTGLTSMDTKEFQLRRLFRMDVQSARSNQLFIVLKLFTLTPSKRKKHGHKEEFIHGEPLPPVPASGTIGKIRLLKCTISDKQANGPIDIVCETPRNRNSNYCPQQEIQIIW